MKKITLLVFIICFQISSAQEFSVEKSTFSAQVGAFGGWINNESRLGNQFTLKSEIGLDFFNGSSDGISFDVLSPAITLEPRWYYNLEKRGNKGRNVQNNGGNFLALTVSYHPDWFVISQYDNMVVPNQIAIIPKWGIKRNFGKSNFNYEVGIGLGINYRFLKEYGYSENDIETILDTHFRIGYTFKSSRNK